MRSSRETSASIVLACLDHLVLTVASIERSVRFYADVLGMTPQRFAGGTRVSLHWGTQKINLHETGKEFDPKARLPTAGSADLCFITHVPIEDVVRVLRARHVPIEDGPVRRTGACGPILSVYVRDPDENLIEIANVL